MSDKPAGCTREIAKVGKPAEPAAEQTKKEEVVQMSRVQVGRPAPDFEAMAYFKGEYKPVKLSEYLGKWLLLCFYPGDFTFV